MPKKKQPKEMTNKEFNRRLVKAMKRHGIPCPSMKEIVQGGGAFGTTIERHEFDERSLEGFLEAKRYRDEVRACLGRSVTIDELFF